MHFKAFFFAIQDFFFVTLHFLVLLEQSICDDPQLMINLLPKCFVNKIEEMWPVYGKFTFANTIHKKKKNPQQRCKCSCSSMLVVN